MGCCKETQNASSIQNDVNLCAVAFSDQPIEEKVLCPMVTVITATFNLIKGKREEAFRRCVQSVSDQDLPNVEHWILDGGSTDGTVQLIIECAKRSKAKVRFLSKRDTGIYDAMNRGIHLAQGKYLAFLNSDDFYHDRRGLRKSVAYLEKRKGDFSYAPARILDENGRSRRHIHCFPNPSKFPFSWPFSHQSMLFRRAMMVELGGYDCTYKSASDYDFVLRAVLAGKVGVYVPCRFASFLCGGFSKDNEELSHREVGAIFSRNYHPFCETLTPAMGYRMFVKGQISDSLYCRLSPFLRHSFPEFESSVESMEKARSQRIQKKHEKRDIHIGFPYAYRKEHADMDRYYRALLKAILSLEGPKKLVPWILGSPCTKEGLLCPGVQISSNCSMIRLVKYWANWLIARIYHIVFDPDLYRMDREPVDVLSHTELIGTKPTIVHISDSLLWGTWDSNPSVESRDEKIKSILFSSDSAIVDSEIAVRRVCQYDWAEKSQIFCLHPMAVLEEGLYSWCDTTYPSLVAKYALPKKYYVVPMEDEALVEKDSFWESIAALKRQNSDIVFLFVSSHNNSENGSLFEKNLSSWQKNVDVGQTIRILIVQDRKETLCLMRNSVAVVYPSTSNRWSISMEECQSLGKQVILSDTPIHREQNPLGATYFPVGDATASVSVFETVWKQLPGGPSCEMERNAQKALPKRLKAFGEAYRDIVLQTYRVENLQGP